MIPCIGTPTCLPLNEIEKLCIDNELKKYPNLQKLVADSPKLYQLRYNPYEKEIKKYQEKLIDNNGGVLSEGVQNRIKVLRSKCELYSLGGILLEESKSKSCWTAVLEYLESILKYAPEIYTSKYQSRICTEFQQVVSELTIYDVLHKLGYGAEYEPNVCNTESKPDFRIYGINGEECFIEAKIRFESFEEILQSLGESALLEQTEFADIDEPSYKLSTVVCTAINGQISKWNQSNPNIPVYLVIESMVPGFFALNLNKEALLSHLRIEAGEKDMGAAVTEIPENLKAIIVFTFLPRKIKICLLSSQQHEVIGKFKKKYEKYISIDEC